MSNQLFRVGEYQSRFNELTGQQIPCVSIYQSDGLITHIHNRHPGEEKLLEYIPEIIRCPDYVGKNPKEPDSVELVKQVDKNVMVCIKLDIKNGYLYVASVYPISEAKLNRHLFSGRLKSY